MTPVNRRQFLEGALLTGGVLTSSLLVPEALAEVSPEAQAVLSNPALGTEVNVAEVPIDFRYSPILRQTVFCFPDDPHKSLLNENGDLLYGYERDSTPYFPLQIRFALSGMRQFHAIRQTLEAPAIPIVRTELEDATATMTLTTFATNNPDEGRVDNVTMEIRPRNAEQINVSPVVQLLLLQRHSLSTENGILVVTEEKTQKVLLLGKVFENPSKGSIADIFNEENQELVLHRGIASSQKPYRAFFRFPQEAQTSTQLERGLNRPERQLADARAFWTAWSPFHQPVSWQLTGTEAGFVSACARNILQAREVRDGKLTFEVGPTCYRGLWVVDGNFILEAARYMGYDKEAMEGLRTTWSNQQPSGQIIAGGGSEHWKDTAIAMFTLVRQCELSQDWTQLRELEPNVVAAIQFLDSLRVRARKEGSALGRYGLLAKGFGDGGLGGIRDEFTNTLWTMAGLKAIGAAGERLNLRHVARATTLYRELFAAFSVAAPQEMRSYEGKFQYLPMLLKNDPAWRLPDPWDRPRPQCAQWALSHTIFPGCVFAPQHPVVKGHVDLMLAVRQEGIPAGTGWQPHEAVWNYNAAFVAEVLLWVGMREQANSIFRGFLNHASPQYCWREEQPLQEALVGSYTGDMPHNWASAECIRYMRHILALEDGPDLRLLAGITQTELTPWKPFILHGTPTCFGRLDLAFEPLDRKQGWRLAFRRLDGLTPASVSVPHTLDNRFRLSSTEGVRMKKNGEMAMIDPTVQRWSLIWNA